MTIKEKTCCFTGHREIPAHLYPALTKALEETLRGLIRQGVLYYGAGGALGFDTLAARTVLRLREEMPQIRLILVLPCPQQDRYWNLQDQKIYRDIMNRADKVVFLSPNYTRGCMHRRNRHLVDCSSVCVAYCIKPSGGTAYTVAYAKQKGLSVINLAGRLSNENKAPDGESSLPGGFSMKLMVYSP